MTAVFRSKYLAAKALNEVVLWLFLFQIIGGSIVNEKLYTVDEVADYLRVKKSFVYLLTRQGLIDFIKMGKYCRFEKKSIDKFLQQRKNHERERA